MPTYEYECRKCNHHFEVFQSMSDEPIKKCPKCKKDVRRIIFGGTGVIFKGSGFYVTDKNGTKPPAAKEAKNTADSAESNNSTSKEPKSAETKPSENCVSGNKKCNRCA